MPKLRLASEEDRTEINLSPMIDCIFILLIFFIVTTVFVEEQGIQVNKPDAAASVSLEDTESVSFEITAEDTIVFEGEEISLRDVANRVKAAAVDEETPITIRAHEKSAHETFVQVWDAAKRGGATALSFTTIN